MRVPLPSLAALPAAVLLLSACSGHSGSALAQLENDAAAAPVIVAQPQALAVHDGDSAMFQVATTGTEPATYEWQRDGQPISGATGRTYRLQSVSPRDDGAQFRVVVINDYGAVVSDAGPLIVTRETARWPWE